MDLKEYYIFEAEPEYIENLGGDLLLVRAGRVQNGFVMEARYTWELFFFKSTPQLVRHFIYRGDTNSRNWEVDMSEFRECFIDYEGKNQRVYLHKSVKEKKSFWKKLFGK